MQLLLGMDHFVDKQFLPLFHEWNATTVDRSAMGAGWPTTCVLCGKDHVKTSVAHGDLMSRITYAQLKVSCGKHEGLGLLMRLSDRVVCVSCNHIFVDYSLECPIEAVSANHPDIAFQLKPLTQIRQYQDDSETLPATDEIILLEPCWNGNILFDLSMLISPEDWTDAPMNTMCICYGCNDDGQMVWSDPIQIVAPVPVDYYQIKGEGLTEIQPGFSGGIYVGTDSQPRQIVGIHEGRFDELKKARMIPWASVQAAIKKVSERGFNNGEST